MGADPAERRTGLQMGGEEHAWEVLGGSDPVRVCRNAGVEYCEATGSYQVTVLGQAVTVAAGTRTMAGGGADGEALLGKLAYFSRLSILHYLAGAKDLPFSGRLVGPADLKVGPIYFRGSHVLPLSAVAAKYGRDVEGFLRQAVRWGGVRCGYGDAAVVLPVFTRLPVTLILWRGDDEFEARSDLLFDATCEEHVPADILWSIAMLAVMAMVKL